MALALTHQALEIRVSPSEPTLLECVEAVAGISGRPYRAILLQGLLQLPRIANEHGLFPLSAGKALISELVEELPTGAEWFVLRVDSPRSLRFHGVREACALDVMERFHYLRSPRPGGRAYGLSTAAEQLVAVCVSSAMDVPLLGELLALHGRPAVRARTISRVFAFEGAPENSISYLLSRVARAEHRLGVTDLVTYVNPNMGFTGSSYRASGWHLLGEESGTTYRYLDQRYITDRQLAARFGRQDDRTYRRRLGDRFAVSTMALAPLLVFHRPLKT